MMTLQFRGVPEVHQNIAQMLYHAAVYADASRRQAPLTDRILGMNQGMTTAMAKDPDFRDSFELKDSNKFISAPLSYEVYAVDKLGWHPLKEMIQRQFGNEPIAQGTADLMEQAVLPYLGKYSQYIGGASKTELKNFFSPIFNYVKSLENTEVN